MLNFQMRRQRHQDWVTVTGRDTGEVLFWASPILELVYNQKKEKSVSQDIYKVKWMKGEKEQVLSLSGKENVQLTEHYYILGVLRSQISYPS